jgi:predicted O-methyltransferase YrrM
LRPHLNLQDKIMTVYNDSLSQYITQLFAVQDPAMQQVWEETPKKGLPAISVKPEEGRFLQFLVRASGATRALEIGTLGGYSGSWIARGLAPGGRLITLELEPLHAEVARQHFVATGVADRVEIRVGNAHHSLQSLSAEAPFDFIFIDAEKPGYPDYFEWALEHTAVGGIIAAHNAFRSGAVADPANNEALTELMRGFNRRVAGEPRLISTIFPAGDGIVVGVKTV